MVTIVRAQGPIGFTKQQRLVPADPDPAEFAASIALHGRRRAEYCLIET
jgi:hypothetical protein